MNILPLLLQLVALACLLFAGFNILSYQRHKLFDTFGLIR
jgi:hypothetical protein